ncbi:MAG TPA: SLC13 family permease [Gammaproteobacteria bacterium]|nr:SLC13 family permease [Gammaproteobacteria bacterium]
MWLLMDGLNVHAVATMLLTAGALFLFTRERISLYLSCITVLFVLVLYFELFPYVEDGDRLGAGDFFSVFGNEALITIVFLLILSKGVEVSGALQPLTRLLVRLWLMSRSLAFLATLLSVAVLSAFVNNTPIVVILLPVLVGVAHRIRIPPSRILMPIGFATILGGMSTTIGTSTNLLVISIANEQGAQSLGMFDFALPAAIAGLIGIAFLWAVAPRLLPDRPSPLSPSTTRVFESVIEIADAGQMAEKMLGEVRPMLPEGISISRIQRGEGLELVRLPTLTLRPGDKLFVRGTAAGIKRLQDLFGGGFEADDLRRLPDHVLAEIVVTRDSPLFGRRLSEARQLTLGRLIPIGTLTVGKGASRNHEQAIDDPVLGAGDVLLMQGRRQDIRELQEKDGLLILERSIHIARSGKAPLAVLIMAAVVAASALGWMPILASASCGAALMILLRCLSLEEARSAIDTNLLLVIATSLALGTALTSTGAAEFLALEFVDLVRGLPPPVVLSAILLLTALLTEVVTNNAIAVIGTPIAIVAAQELGVQETAFVLAVLFGANMSYLTPIGYQTNLLVFTAGGYRFSDFLRVGIPLQIILWLALSFLLSALYL